MSVNQTTQDAGTRYFHTDGREVFGPFEPQALIELEISGRINRNTMVCIEGTETWVKLSESPLADSLPKRPRPPLPTPAEESAIPSADEATAQANLARSIGAVLSLAFEKAKAATKTFPNSRAVHVTEATAKLYWLRIRLLFTTQFGMRYAQWKDGRACYQDRSLEAQWPGHYSAMDELVAKINLSKQELASVTPAKGIPNKLRQIAHNATIRLRIWSDKAAFTHEEFLLGKLVTSPMQAHAECASSASAASVHIRATQLRDDVSSLESRVPWALKSWFAPTVTALIVAGGFLLLRSLERSHVAEAVAGLSREVSNASDLEAWDAHLPPATGPTATASSESGAETGKTSARSEASAASVQEAAPSRDGMDDSADLAALGAQLAYEDSLRRRAGGAGTKEYVEALGKDVLQHDPRAIYHWVLLGEKNFGPDHEPNMSFTMIKEAAAKGHLMSQLLLADYYLKGFGCERNEEEAALWLRKAAGRGSAEAREKLQAMGVALDER